MASKLILHTDRIPEEYQTQVDQLLNKIVPADVEVERYNHNIEVSWRDINKYAECVTVDDMLAVNPDYKNDLTSDGEWVYPLPNMVECGDVIYGLFYNAHNLRKVKLILPKATFIGWMFCIEYPSALEEVDIEAPSVNYPTYVGCGHILQGMAAPKKMRFVLPNQRSLRQFFFSTPPAYPQRLELYAPKMTEGEFLGASIDKISVLEIIDRLQTFTSGTHSLSISIHVDHQYDDEVLAAIANAEVKGWTLTVQWNGKPTAQASVTYGLRKPPIYAKVSEAERPDGTMQRYLDWGHYVTDPTSYEEFRSAEEAREYFGLPIEDEISKPD